MHLGNGRNPYAKPWNERGERGPPRDREAGNYVISLDSASNVLHVRPLPPWNIEFLIESIITRYQRKGRNWREKGGKKRFFFFPGTILVAERESVQRFPLFSTVSLSLSRLCPLRGEKKKRKKKPLRSGMKQRRFITFLRRRRDRERERKRELLFSKENIPFARNSGFLITSGN